MIPAHTSARTCLVSLLCAVSMISVCHGQSFSVTTSPAQVTIFPGQTNVPVTVKVSSLDYAGPVSITFSGLPSGITATPLTIVPGQSAAVKLSATVSAGQEGFQIKSPNLVPAWTA